MTKREADRHNWKVITNVATALIENRMVDVPKFLTNAQYAWENIGMYIQAANIAREAMNMPKLYLIDLNELEEED